DPERRRYYISIKFGDGQIAPWQEEYETYNPDYGFSCRPSSTLSYQGKELEIATLRHLAKSMPLLVNLETSPTWYRLNLGKSQRRAKRNKAAIMKVLQGYEALPEHATLTQFNEYARDVIDAIVTVGNGVSSDHMEIAGQFFGGLEGCN
ncbi:hypothetical protein H0H92_011237, partial [Tricholoma furcatifolium]